MVKIRNGKVKVSKGNFMNVKSLTKFLFEKRLIHVPVELISTLRKFVANIKFPILYQEE